MKNIIVQKFGGTSVADINRIQNVADLVCKEKKSGHHVVVVVSAMSGVTDELVKKVHQISGIDNKSAKQEYDVAVSVGEQISASLLALTLQKKGYKSRSWLSWQLPIISDDNFNKAEIISINKEKIMNALAKDEIPVITGFQAVCEERVTTIGRGGSDTTAVAIAAALSAKRCDIYTDVNGIFTADPNIVKDAKKLDSISYKEMLELSSLGAKVLNTKSVELAMEHKVPLRVLSSFQKDSGTSLVFDLVKHNKLITAIAHNTDEAKVTVVVPVDIGITRVLGAFAQHNIKLDMIVQIINKSFIDLTFTVQRSELSQVIKMLQDNKELFGYKAIESDVKVSKVSVVGCGIHSNCKVIQQMFEALAEKNIELILVSTSETKISVLIQEEQTEIALQTLHKKFNL